MLDLTSRKMFCGHDGVHHVVVRVVRVLDPSVLHGSLVDIRPRERRQCRVDRQVRPQLEGEPPQLADRLHRVPPRAQDEHRLREYVVIVEDLDKTDLDTVKQLFHGHAISLLAPSVSIVYTFPTALRHDNDFMQIEMNFPNVCILPNLKARSRDGEPDEEGLARLRDILTKRVNEVLFTSEALASVVRLSSGIPRELIALARRACLEAMRSGQPPIDEKHIERAAQSKRMDYQVLLTPDQLDLLRQVQHTKRVKNDEEHRGLLHNLSALEYLRSSVLRVILNAVKILTRRKGRVVLCCLNGYVGEVFEVNRFKDIITITDSVESGLKAFACELKAA